jgi:tetratricopeptide (TPR) repeat protein
MPKPTSVPGLPRGWDPAAQATWIQGDKQGAIDAVLKRLNAIPPQDRPVEPILQLSYYIFLAGDPGGAVRFLEHARQRFPRHAELLLNLSVCLYRSGRYEEALLRVDEVLALTPDDIAAHDGKCSTLSRLGRHAEAAATGTRALHLKDLAAAPPAAGWKLPAATPAEWAARPGKRNVIAFSLWGGLPRYTQGALDNALAAPRIYPGWTPVYFVDETVPQGLVADLEALGADVRMEPAGQGLRQKLAWRFRVANDPGVGRFLVRDVDSVIGEREKAAVEAWIASGKWFHAMRDWWTHTDLMLAGMWGGVAGVLPDLGALLAAYRPRAAETPNVDQWFLRDCVWSYVRSSCLVHDRYFSPPGAVPWPLPDPPGNYHVGQNEYAVRRIEQEERLKAPRVKG